MAVIDQYALCSLTDLKEYLDIAGSDEDPILTRTVNRASAWIESYCNRNFLKREYYEWHDGNGQKELLLRNWPVSKCMLIAHGVQNSMTVSSSTTSDLALMVSVGTTTLDVDRIDSAGTRTQTSYDLTTSNYNTTAKVVAALDSVTGVNATLAKNIPSQWLHRLEGRDVMSASVQLTFPPDAESEYRLNPERGQISLRWSPIFYGEHPDERANRFPQTNQSVLVWYSAGYESVPYDVQQAALEVSSATYAMRSHDPSLGSESLGDYSYSLRAPQEIYDQMNNLLGPYRKIN